MMGLLQLPSRCHPLQHSSTQHLLSIRGYKPLNHRSSIPAAAAWSGDVWTHRQDSMIWRCGCPFFAQGQSHSALPARLRRSVAKKDDVQALSAVLPGAETLIEVNRPLAVRLAEDPAAVALKLVSLRTLFPDANLLAMIEKRPTILEDEEFGQVENNLKNLQENLPGADVLGLIEQQPLFLFENIKAILGEMQSLRPSMALPDIVNLLAKDDKFAFNLLLKLNIRSQVRRGIPRMRYP